MVTDARLSELASRLGKTHAQAVWDAGLAAIDQIDAIVRGAPHRLRLRLGRRLPARAGRHPPDAGERPIASKPTPSWRASSASTPSFVDEVPFAGGPGVRVERPGADPSAAVPCRARPRHRGRGRPRLRAERRRVPEASARPAAGDGPIAASVNGFAVTCDDVVIATHNPLAGVSSLPVATLFQTKLALYTSYVVAARVPTGRVPDALWWDTGDPYRYRPRSRRARTTTS